MNGVPISSLLLHAALMQRGPTGPAPEHPRVPAILRPNRAAAPAQGAKTAPDPRRTEGGAT